MGKAYNIYLVNRVEGGLHIDELWPIPADFDESGILRRRDRVDRWLENADEFGTMLFAVTSYIHGGWFIFTSHAIEIAQPEPETPENNKFSWT